MRRSARLRSLAIYREMPWRFTLHLGYQTYLRSAEAGASIDDMVATAPA
ncbi:hypothetical protein [Pseudomonas sp. LB3P31]